MKPIRRATNLQSDDPDRATELEYALADAGDGTAAATRFMHALSAAAIWILVDKDHSKSRHWDPDTSMLFVADEDGNPMLATFTSPDFATNWFTSFPDFAFGMQLDFNWILARLPEHAGLIVNPASALETRVTPAQLNAFKPRH